MDSGVDTGPIIYQKLVELKNPNLTFSMSYKALFEEIEQLFMRNYQSIIENTYSTIEQAGKGSYHKSSDLPKWLTDWDIKISDAVVKFNEK